ncbi:MAG TPA: energy transducer TonB [Acidobacteriaceae bacterium]|jgi:periplasmic protein TonB|nr:energy transducer TonB [Acidobacteriaceae bacterium]
MIDTDAELEQALSAAFARETAPATLIPRVEAAIREVSVPAPFVPTFAGLTIRTQSRLTSLVSLGAHVIICALIVLFVLNQWHTRMLQQKMLASATATPFIPISDLKDVMGGGGGGGNHETVEASKGKLPKFAKDQIVPPQILKIDNPKLAQEPTVVMPPIKLPDAANMPDLGIPQSTQIALASQGSGSGSGFGSGSGGGIGSGRGNGIGPGEGGGYGGGLMHLGGGVSAPTLIYSPDPEFSDEARRAKYQGICVVGLIVDAAGDPQDIHIVRALGMGLDQKAMEAVRQYKFKPAMFKGHPVAVAINIEVNFRIY